MPWKSPEFALATFQHSPSAQLLIAAASGAVLAANHRFAELFAHPVDALVGRTLADLHLWSAGDPAQAFWADLELRDEAGEVELLLRPSEGRPIPCLCTGAALRVRDDRAYLLVITDLRARKVLEQQVAAAQASFLQLFQNSPVLMALADLSRGTLFEGNRCFFEVTGYSAADLAGTPFWALPIWDDPAALRAILAEVEKGAVVRGRELRFRPKTGGSLWGRCTFAVTAFGDGGALLLSMEDITEQKRLERDDSLKTSVLQYLFEHSEDPLYVKDREGRYLLCNEATARMLGDFHRADVEGHRLSELISGPLLATAEESDRRVIEGGQSTEYEQSLGSEGAPRWVLARKGPWRTETGEVEGVIGMTREITAQKQLQEQLRHQNQMKDRLLTILAHDLRGPVGGAAQLISLVGEQVKDQPDLAEIFDLLQRSSNQTYDLLENLLAWVQGRLAPLSGTSQSCDVAGALAAVQAWLGPLAIRKRLDLRVTAEPGLTLALDERSLQTIVRNLVSNAIKFTPAGGEVLLLSRRNRGAVEILVQDNGVGMPPEKAAALFGDRQVASARGTGGEGGSGLGLMFCADLVRDLGGTIAVMSRPGQGSTFTLRF